MAEISARFADTFARRQAVNKFRKQIDCNLYHKIKNPKGIIDLSSLNNQLCEDLILVKFSSSEAPKCTSDDLCHSTSYGTVEFREALVTIFKKYFRCKVPVSKDNVIVTSSLPHSLDQLIFSVTEAEDAVLVPVPCREVIPLVCGGRRCQVKLYPVLLSQENGYVLTREMLEKATVDATSRNLRIKGLLLSNPQDPVGVTYTKEQILDYLQFAKSHKLHVIINEVLPADVLEKTSKFCSTLSLDELPDPERTHLTWSISDNIGISGHNCGAVLSWNKAILDGLRTVTFNNIVPTLIQSQLTWLLQQDDWLEKDFFPTMCARCEDARNKCQERLETLGVSVFTSQGQHHVWADFSKFLPKLTFTAENILVEKFIEGGVYMKPGQLFHTKTPGCLQIVFSCYPETMETACQRIEATLKSVGSMDWKASSGLDLDLEDLEISGATTSEAHQTIEDILKSKDNVTAATSQGLEIDLEDLHIEAGTTKGSGGMEHLIRSLKDCISSSDWLKPGVPQREAQERVWTVLEPPTDREAVPKTSGQEELGAAGTETTFKSVDAKSKDPKAFSGFDLDLDDLEIVGVTTSQEHLSIQDILKSKDMKSKDPLPSQASQGLDVSSAGDDKTLQAEALTGAAGGGESLEDLMRSLKQGIEGSDWLKSEAGKWEAENPQTAVEYRKAMTEKSEEAECKQQ